MQIGLSDARCKVVIGDVVTPYPSCPSISGSIRRGAFGVPVKMTESSSVCLMSVQVDALGLVLLLIEKKKEE